MKRSKQRGAECVILAVDVDISIGSRSTCVVCDAPEEPNPDQSRRDPRIHKSIILPIPPERGQAYSDTVAMAFSSYIALSRRRSLQKLDTPTFSSMYSTQSHLLGSLSAALSPPPASASHLGSRIGCTVAPCIIGGARIGGSGIVAEKAPINMGIDISTAHGYMEYVQGRGYVSGGVTWCDFVTLHCCGRRLHMQGGFVGTGFISRTT